LTTGAISGVIIRLADAGLVQREADPADARRVRVVPRADARDAVEALMRPLGERLQSAAGELSPAEQRVLLRFVDAASTIVGAEARGIRYQTDP